MKKIILVLSVAALTLGLVSCGGPEADAKKMLNKIEKITEALNKAVADEKIDDAEVAEINKISKEIDEINIKYENADEATKEKFTKYLEDNQEQVEKVYGEFFKVAMTVSQYEGSENIEM